MASTFISTPGWAVRGITRHTNSASSKYWSAKGVNMVQADLDNTNKVIAAFRGAHAIFCVTNWWQEFGFPGNWAKAAQTGEDIRKICYDIEVQRGKNMVDAAAIVVEDGILDRLILSVCPDTLGQSGGKIKDNYHFDAKWAWVCCSSLISTIDSANVNPGNPHSQCISSTSREDFSAPACRIFDQLGRRGGSPYVVDMEVFSANPVDMI